jgi:SagB-type dehydrogenase family enzyme
MPPTTTSILPGPHPSDAHESTALAYTEQVFRRLREPMPPLGYRVDWADQPSRHKIHEGGTLLPLPQRCAELGASLDDAIRLSSLGPEAPPGGGVDLARLGDVLGAYGLTGRRLQLNWNEDARPRTSATRSVWARPTPSGGGMYPVESYLVTGDGPLPAGTYHYSSAHHALDRLALGDHRHRVHRALGAPDQPDGVAYLVAAVRFWKNSFKYNSFCYHVVSQDVGALLASWRLLLAAHGEHAEPSLWFDEALVHEALGLDGLHESAFAVVPVRWAPDLVPAGPATESTKVATAAPASREDEVWERSRVTRGFAVVDAVQATCLAGADTRPDPGRAAEGGVTDDAGRVHAWTALPPPTALAGDLGRVMTARRSSFGLFSSGRPLGADELGTVLAGTSRLRHAGTDVAPAPGRAPWTRLHVLANHVDGLGAGAYAYDEAAHRLGELQRTDVGRFAQQHYALTNYNMREVAAVLVISGRLPALVAAYGDPGYRMLNADVGAQAQAAYLAATALGLGVGAVLGLDNLAVDELLGLDGTDERSLLFVLLGHERVGRASYSHSILAGSSEGHRS